MKYQERIIKTGFYIFLTVAVVWFVYALFCNNRDREAYIGSFESFSHDKGWTLVSEKVSMDEVTLPLRLRVEKGEPVTIHNTLPADIGRGMSLAFRAAAEDVEIRIDGKVRGDYQMNDTDSHIGYLPSSYVFVDLDASDAGKDIDIRIAAYSSGYATINTLEYSYGNNIWFGHLRENLLKVFVAVTLILLAIVAAAVFAVLHKKVGTGSSFLYLSQFIIVISLWVLSESGIRQLFFSASYWSSIIAYLLVETIAAYAVMFVDELQNHYYQRVFLVIETVIILQLIVNTILNFAGLVYYHDTLLLSHVWSVVAIVAVWVTLILDVRSGRIRNYQVAACGLVGLMICSVVEILFFYLTDRRLLGLPIGLGLLILIATTLIQTITDILALKQQRDQNEMAAHIANEANQAKSDFLAQMSHEIRTPINAVLGMNEMILRESKDQAVTEYAANAYNAGKALLAIINDILDISKIEAGKMEILNADYEVYSLVSDCYNLTADRAEKKGLKYTYAVDEKLPVKLNGDMFHIRQIVVNFLTNAIKYTDEGSVELLFSGRDTEDGYILQFSVRDTGIGLTKESQEKLFGNFERFDIKRNRSVEGTGLGLSICKHLAGLMDGSITVESVYGEGSTFSCMIPQTVVDKTPIGKVVINQCGGVIETAGAGRSFTAERARILVVDDVDMNIVVFRSLLKEHSMRIDAADSGAQCLEKVKKQKYDLIFMDHMMPEMDGMETYEHMKETEHLNRDTPVIMLTANAISGEKEKYMDAGFAAYLTKPIQSEKLQDILLTFLPKELIAWKDGNADNAGGAEKRETGGVAVNGGISAGSALPVEGALPADAALSAELINRQRGLAYAANDEEIYLTVLGSYVDKGEENRARLRALFREESWKDYTIAVHALKSTSLTIGAEGLSKAAERLEAAGKSGDYGTIQKGHEALTELYKKVLAEGREILANHERGAEASEDNR